MNSGARDTNIDILASGDPHQGTGQGRGGPSRSCVHGAQAKDERGRVVARVDCLARMRAQNRGRWGCYSCHFAPPQVTSRAAFTCRVQRGWCPSVSVCATPSSSRRSGLTPQPHTATSGHTPQHTLILQIGDVWSFGDGTRKQLGCDTASHAACTRAHCKLTPQFAFTLHLTLTPHTHTYSSPHTYPSPDAQTCPSPRTCPSLPIYLSPHTDSSP